MAGFSASGNFANRFALLHPSRTRAVATGGVVGFFKAKGGGAIVRIDPHRYQEQPPDQPDGDEKK